MRLSDFDVLSFDCYGTLIDWESGIVAALAPWLEAHGVDADRERILAAFARAEAPQQQATPGMLYRDLLAVVHGTIAEQFGLPQDAAAARAFGASVEHWPAFPDSPTALAYLKQHYQLVILSNVDRASFLHSNRRLGVAFDAVYTAEDVGSYKPDPRNFEHLLASLGERGIERAQILHTAESLFHDHLPAQRCGLATCWIHRRAGQDGFGATRAPEGEVRPPDFRFESLAAMAEAHRAEQSG
jgi:2-haloalkanoic acid dehalogenase type II